MYRRPTNSPHLNSHIGVSAPFDCIEKKVGGNCLRRIYVTAKVRLDRATHRTIYPLFNDKCKSYIYTHGLCRGVSDLNNFIPTSDG